MAIQTVTLPSTNNGSTRRLRRARRAFEQAWAHQKAHEWTPAAEGFTVAITCDPENAFPALANRGMCYHHLNRPIDALADYARAMRIGTPDQRGLIRVNRGVLLATMRRYTEALEDFGADGSQESQLNAAYIHLAHGDYEKGLALYRQRPTAKNRRLRKLDELAGKSVLILHEQGFGDSIQMARFVPQVAAVAKSVHWTTRTALMPLLAYNFPNVRFSDGNDIQAAALCQKNEVVVLVMDLWQTTGLETRGGQFLRACPLRVEKMQAVLPPGRRIALSWRGRTSFANDHNRSMTIDALAPLFIGSLAGARFVSMQKDLRADEFGVFDGGALINDFADSAALIACCDAVITVDTATAHLAGALGIKTAILLPYAADWRWGIEGDTTPWYDSARLFRQPAYGAWAPAVAAAAEWLR